MLPRWARLPKPVYCDECGSIIGEVRGGRVVVFSRHHGHRHETVLVKGLDKPSVPVQD